MPVYRNQTGFLYDPEKVPNPPQTWAEFTAWLDANPGQFAFNDPSKGGSGQAFVQTAIVNMLGDDGRATPAPPSVDPAEDRRLAQGVGLVQRQRGQVHHHRIEQRFDRPREPGRSADGRGLGRRHGGVDLAKGTLFKRAKLYIPQLGLPGGGDSLGIPANAPHKAARCCSSPT